MLITDAANRQALLALSAEAASTGMLDELAGLTGASPALFLTIQRVQALGIDLPPDLPVRYRPRAGLSLEMVRELSDPTRAARAGTPLEADFQSEEGACARAAILLVKAAGLLPAAIVADLPPSQCGQEDLKELSQRHDLLSVRAEEILDYDHRSATSLTRVAEVGIPIETVGQVRVVGFRPSDGGAEHLALLVGSPAPGRPVLVRLHSACLTGDLLGSLRCDCGPQLRGALGEIAAAGEGIVLYLAQEGRGIGLMNKFRSYRLQDAGLDTVDANTALGFEADERVYLSAALMLRQLGFRQVRLMTNNPDKVAQLAACGIDVIDRIPHVVPANRHNEAYLRTKLLKSGHLF